MDSTHIAAHARIHMCVNMGVSLFVKINLCGLCLEWLDFNHRKRKKFEGSSCVTSGEILKSLACVQVVETILRNLELLFVSVVINLWTKYWNVNRNSGHLKKVCTFSLLILNLNRCEYHIQVEFVHIKWILLREKISNGWLERVMFQWLLHWLILQQRVRILIQN